MLITGHAVTCSLILKQINTWSSMCDAAEGKPATMLTENPSCALNSQAVMQSTAGISTGFFFLVFILTLPSAATWKTVLEQFLMYFAPNPFKLWALWVWPDHSTSEICPLNDAGNFSVFGLWRLLDWDPLMVSCKRSGVFIRTLILWTCYKWILIFTHCY